MVTPDRIVSIAVRAVGATFLALVAVLVLRAVWSTVEGNHVALLALLVALMLLSATAALAVTDLAIRKRKRGRWASV